MSDEINNNYLKEKIFALFNAAKDVVGNQALVTKAKKIYNKGDPVEWLSNFIDAMKYCLVYPDKIAAGRMLLFVAKFAASIYTQKTLVDDDSEETEEEEHPFVSGLFNFIFNVRNCPTLIDEFHQVHSAVLVDARLRCTTLINHILSALPDDSWLPVSIWNGLTEMIRTRLQDRNSSVRVAAVLVARKLQEPKNPKCEIVKLLSFHMTDPAPAVRRAVISSIALSKVTITDVLSRTLDINENVRRNAYAVIAKARYQSLSMTQRITILERGLNDRSERVRACTEQVLLPQWLDHVGNDALKLIEGLDVVNCSGTTLQALEGLTRSLPLEDFQKSLPFDASQRVVPIESLSPETALLWLFLVFKAHKLSNEEMLESMLPNISAFVLLIESWYPLSEKPPSQDDSEAQWAQVKRKTVFKLLLEMGTVFDMTDEVGRSKIKLMCISMLTNPLIGSQLVEKLVELLKFVCLSTEQFISSVLEVISDVREPLTQVLTDKTNEEQLQMKIEISKYKLTLHELRDREQSAVASKNYIEAAKIASEIDDCKNQIETLSSQPVTVLSEHREERTDPETICKCLKILTKSVTVSGVKTLTPELRSLESLIIQSSESGDLLTQSLSIQALAQFCILDKSMLQNYLLNFLLMLSENGENEVNLPALRAVFDTIQIHGLDCLKRQAENEDGRDSQTIADDTMVDDDEFSSQQSNEQAKRPALKCLAVLKELLKCCENDDLKRTVFEGFCKLLATEVVYSPSLLKTVIVKGFTPIRGNEADDRIRQFFMVFFPAFARNASRSQQMIESAFIPVMRQLKEARLGSTEADTNPKDVASFLLAHTKPGINSRTSSTVHVHNTLALSLCHEILRELSAYPDTEPDHNYLRSILQLDLTLDSNAYVQQVLTLLAKIKRETHEATGLRLVKQLQLKFKDTPVAVSVQNTLSSNESAPTNSRSSSMVRSTFAVTQKTLADVTEETEDYSIIDGSGSSDRLLAGKCVVPESPEQNSD